ncbi:exostosin family-domain-containing protein [Chytridium lagenaria]|nr:exostosin family-domain-containing protein [Chytridium lagenaria]
MGSRSEVLGWRSDVRKRIETAIQLTTVGAVRRYENFDPHKDIVIPPFANLTNAFKVLNAWSGVTLSDVYELFQGVKEILISPGVSMTGKLSMWLSKLSKKLMKLISTQHTRGIFAYFRGTIIPDFRYSHGVRQYLKELGNLYPTRYWIREGHSPYYWHELRNATFSLCPSGWSSWSPRLFDSIVAGAIPVIFADGIALPFEREVDYRKVAVKIGNSDVAKVDEVLRNVTEREVRKKQMVMGRIRHHFVWNSPPKSGTRFT